MKEHFAMMAAYNGWANTRIYAAAGRLPDGDYRADLKSFFGSIHRTLNHILVADTLWMARFGGTPVPDWRLDHIVHEAFADLTLARTAMDRAIVEHVGAQTDQSLAATFTYTPVTNPEPVTQKMAPALAHFFNHQTHHRGQCHAMLTRLDVEAPALDLIYFQRETA
ncbi:MAG: DinB family protein [Pseudomonadota bacterium]